MKNVNIGRMMEVVKRYEKFLFLVSLFTIISVTAYLRGIPAQSYYFNDPDTFYHYERFKMLLNGDIGKFYDKIYPPTGGVPSTNTELYVWWVLITAPLRLFMDTLTAFKYAQVVMFIITSLGIFLVSYLLTKRKWLSLTSILVFGFTLAGWMRTYGGNARGDNVFIGLLMYTLALLILIIRESNVKKLRFYSAVSTVLLLLSVVVWAGGKFGAVFFSMLLGFVILQKLLIKDFELVDKLKKYIIVPWAIGSVILALIYHQVYMDYLLNYGNIELLAISMIGITVVTYVLEYIRKKVEDYRVTLGIALGVAVVGALVFLFKFTTAFSYAIRTYNPISLTIQELSAVSMDSIRIYYTMFGTKLSHSGDGLFYILVMLFGSILLTYKVLQKDKYRNIITVVVSIILLLSLRNPYVSVHGIFISLVGIAMAIVVLYLLFRRIDVSITDSVAMITVISFGILMWWASRFLFFGIVAISVLTPYILEITREVLIRNSEQLRKYAIITLVILLGLSIYANGVITKDYAIGIRGIYYNGKYYGSVPIEYESALEYINQNAGENDAVVTWWDYGYWIESSLLGNRPALIDGSHNRIFDHVVAKWFSSDPTYEFNWDMFNVKWFIAWYADIGKMNAINYLGGSITKDQYMGSSPMIVLRKIMYQNRIIYVSGSIYAELTDENETIVVIGTNKYMAKMTVIPGKGVYKANATTIPVLDYVSYVYNDYMILIRGNVVNSIWYKLATLQYLGDPNIEPEFATIGSTYIVVYKFRPFALYGIRINDNITQIDKLNWTIPSNSTLLIKAYGRDGTGDIIIEYANGSEEIVKSNVYITNETKPFNEVKIDRELRNISDIFFRTWGWYGKFTSLANVNGKEVSPFNIISAIRDGDNTVKVNVEFNEDNIPIRAGIIVYAVVVREEKGYVKTYFEILDKYFPMNGTSKKGEQTISFKFNTNKIRTPNYYYDQLKKKYGEGKVSINVIYMVYVEGYKKYDLLPSYYKRIRITSSH